MTPRGPASPYRKPPTTTSADRELEVLRDLFRKISGDLTLLVGPKLTPQCDCNCTCRQVTRSNELSMVKVTMASLGCKSEDLWKISRVLGTRSASYGSLNIPTIRQRLGCSSQDCKTHHMSEQRAQGKGINNKSRIPDPQGCRSRRFVSLEISVGILETTTVFILSASLCTCPCTYSKIAGVMM